MLIAAEFHYHKATSSW